jgi:hypothetical protein
MTAKDRALELFAMQVGVDEEGKVLLRIQKPSDRDLHDDIYMIKIDRPGRCQVLLKKPHHPRMKLIKRDGQEYIKWRPKWNDIGIHSVTIVFEGEVTSEREISIYVYNKELLDAQREEMSSSD